MHDNLTDAVGVWNQFCESFCGDLQPRMLRYNAPLEDLEDLLTDLGLFLLNDLLLTFRQTLQTYGLPAYQHE